MATNYPYGGQLHSTGVGESSRVDSTRDGLPQRMKMSAPIASAARSAAKMKNLFGPRRA
jgi:hypothetical protein